MKILITGAKGFLGRNLIEKLDLAKNEVVATSLNNHSLAEWAGRNYLKNFEARHLDILDSEECLSVMEGIDVVIHLAASIDIPFSISNPRETITTNYGGTLNILEAMRKNGVKKIIFSSTQAVYGNNPMAKEDEIAKISPITSYALSKIMCEETIKLYSGNYGIYYAIFRASQLYGKYQENGILPMLKDKVAGASLIRIGNNVKRDFLNAQDFAGAIKESLRRKERGIFNIGTGISTSIRGILEMIAESFNKKIRIVKDKNLIRDKKFERWDEMAQTEKLKKTGWRPKSSVKEWVLNEAFNNNTDV